MSRGLPPHFDRLARWAEPMLTGAGALWLGWAAAAALGRGAGWLAAALPLAGAALLAAWAGAAAVRLGVLRRGAATAPGLVVIEEGRVGYLGPEAGGFVALDALVAVGIAPAGDGPGGLRVWRFHAAEGAPLEIPLDAAGAAALPDTLEALPGFDAFRLLRALRDRGRGEVTVWRRPGTRPRPALRLVR